MTVYVTEVERVAPTHRWPYKEHAYLAADEPHELARIADEIGLRPNWLQRRGEWNEHFDITRPFADAARRHGAEVVTKKRLVKIMRRRLPAREG